MKDYHECLQRLSSLSSTHDLLWAVAGSHGIVAHGCGLGRELNDLDLIMHVSPAVSPVLGDQILGCFRKLVYEYEHHRCSVTYQPNSSFPSVNEMVNKPFDTILYQPNWKPGLLSAIHLWTEEGKQVDIFVRPKWEMAGVSHKKTKFGIQPIASWKQLLDSKRSFASHGYESQIRDLKLMEEFVPDKKVRIY